MNINFFNILIISGVIHGIIFSSFILYNKKYRSKSSSNLALVVLFLSLHNLYYWIGDVNLDLQIPYYKNLYIPWNLLILPMYYFFVQNYFSKTDTKKYYFFIPFFTSLSIHVYLFSVFLMYDQISDSIISFKNIFYDVEEYLAALFTIYVIWRTYILIKREEKHSEENQIETSWLKGLLNFGLIICFIWIVLTVFNYSNNITKHKNSSQLNVYMKYFLWLSISFLIYWLGYLGVYHGLVFKQRSTLKKRIKNNTSIITLDNNPKIEKIKQIIEQEKLFLDPSLNIIKISDRLDLNEHYFSTVFNQNSSYNFSIYLNKLRIKEVKKLLVKPEYKNYTLLSIGLESGFNSKSAFYRVFKEETGLTPLEYRKKNMS